MQTDLLSHVEICDKITEIVCKLQVLSAAVHSIERDDQTTAELQWGYDLIHSQVLNSLKIVQQSVISHRKVLDEIHVLAKG